MNHDLANQMIEDIAEINFMEICCQAISRKDRTSRCSMRNQEQTKNFESVI